MLSERHPLSQGWVEFYITFVSHRATDPLVFFIELSGKEVINSGNVFVASDARLIVELIFWDLRAAMQKRCK